MFKDLRGVKEERRGKGRGAFIGYIYYVYSDDDAEYERHEIVG